MEIFIENCIGTMESKWPYTIDSVAIAYMELMLENMFMAIQK